MLVCLKVTRSSAASAVQPLSASRRGSPAEPAGDGSSGERGDPHRAEAPADRRSVLSGAHDGESGDLRVFLCSGS